MAFAPPFQRPFSATFDRRAAAGNSNGLLNNLVAYWSLDETSGQRNDSHGTRHLADTGTVTSTTGKINKAAGVFANGDWLSVAQAGLTVPVSGTLTISVWAYRLSDGMFPTIASIYDAYPGNIQYTLRGVAGSRLSLFLRAEGDSELITANNSFPTGAWKHIIVEINDTDKRLRIWIDGTVTESATYYGAPAASTSVYRVGNSGPSIGAEPFTGLLDEMAVWNSTLSDLQRTALYNGGVGLAYTAFTT